MHSYLNLFITLLSSFLPLELISIDMFSPLRYGLFYTVFRCRIQLELLLTSYSLPGLINISALKYSILRNASVVSEILTVITNLPVESIIAEA